MENDAWYCYEMLNPDSIEMQAMKATMKRSGFQQQRNVLNLSIEPLWWSVDDIFLIFHLCTLWLETLYLGGGCP